MTETFKRKIDPFPPAKPFEQLVENALYDLLGIFQPKVGKWYPSIQLYLWRGWTVADVLADRLRAVYYPVFRKIRVDRIGIYVAGAGALGARVRLGIYRGKDFYPTSLIVDAGEVNAETVGDKELTIDETLDVGEYWLVFITNDSTIDFKEKRVGLTTWGSDPALQLASYHIAQAYGPLPSVFPTGAGEYSNLWALSLRVAEVF